MSQVREIKRRIKSINNTKKITKAMELVAASKMRKAVDQVLISREYSDFAWDVVQRISQDKNIKHPLLKAPKKIKRIALLIISSNRGLCGGFNTNLGKLVNHKVKECTKQEIKIDFYTFGSQVRDHVRKLEYDISADFPKPDLMQDISTISPLAHDLINGFNQKKYQQIFIIYTDFVSSLKQIPRVKLLLPLSREKDTELGEVGPGKPIEIATDLTEYKFEPSPPQVLDQILPRIIETQIYQAVLESDASEHSARMMAMQNASSAADDMVDGLTLAYNQARQAAITQEIAEIVGGVAALSN